MVSPSIYRRELSQCNTPVKTPTRPTSPSKLLPKALLSSTKQKQKMKGKRDHDRVVKFDV